MRAEEVTWLAVHVSGPLWYRTNGSSGWIEDINPPYAQLPEGRQGPDACTTKDGLSWRVRQAGELGVKLLQLEGTGASPPRARRFHRGDLDDSLTCLAEERTEEQPVVPVVVIDLDHFAHINEWLGFSMGDRILEDVERRLSACARCCARTGGDEMVCLLAPCASAEAALEKARELMRVFAQPFTSGEQILRVTASAGVSLYPSHAAELEPLLLRAASALRRAKRIGKNRVEIESGFPARRRGERGKIASSLRGRIDHGQFRMRYQPQVDFDGALQGFEALAEWLHPELGVIGPDQFIPVAEECGRINELGIVLLSIAALQGAQWNLRLGFGGRIAVNVSALQLDRPGFVEQVAGTIEQSRFPASQLELEITETKLITDMEAARQVCGRLRAAGISVCLDDFGVGFASLRLIQDLPLDALKLDRSFIHDLTRRQESVLLVNAVVELAHGRGLRLTAEGVESREELEQLSRTGCDDMQGYFLSPPLDAGAAGALLAERRHWGSLRTVRGQAAGL